MPHNQPLLWKCETGQEMLNGTALEPSRLASPVCFSFVADIFSFLYNSRHTMKRTIAILGFVCLVCVPALAADPAPQKPAPAPTAYPPPKSTRTFSPAPTLADVPYGKHQRQILSLWKAQTDKPAPAVIFIHGGAWLVGDQTGGIEVLLGPGANHARSPADEGMDAQQQLRRACLRIHRQQGKENDAVR